MKRTDQQLEAIRADDDYICVDAGAGSGKTSVLVERIVRLLDDNIDLDAIVAITFTDKAAGEMKQRLRAECRKRAPVDDPDQMNRWRALERRVDSARISTIHSFCMAILKENALRLGLDPDFAILADADAHLLYSRVVKETLLELLENNDSAAMALAEEYGAYTLETMLLAMRHKRLALERFVDSSHYDFPDALIADWSRKAQLERARIVNRLRQPSQLPALLDRAHALEGLCKNPNEKYERFRLNLVARGKAFLESTSQNPDLRPLLQLIEKDATRGKTADWVSPEASEQAKALITQLKRLLERVEKASADPSADTSAARATCHLVRLYRTVAARLVSEKHRIAAYDFDDLIIQAFRVLRDYPEVRDRLAKGIDHLLIDEFQDTDPLQLEIAMLLRNSAHPPRLFIVGDAKQSIYYFRGAEVGVFNAARNAAGKIIPLDKNFRSSPDILGFINGFFRSTNLLADVEPRYRGLQPNKTTSETPCIEFIYTMPIDGANAQEYREKEAQLIVARIRERCKDTEYGRVAILFRAMSDAAIYEQALREADIPYSLVAGRGYFERQEVLDIRNLLTVLLDPWNAFALLALLRSPITGMSDEEILAFKLDAPDKLGFAAAFQRFNGGNARYADKLNRVKTLLADLDARMDWPLPLFMRYVLDRTAYEAICLGQYLGAIKAANVRKLVDLAVAFAASDHHSLAAFVAYLDEVAAEEIQEGDAALHTEGINAVTLTTIHKAKGLEFDIVFVADLGRAARGGGNDPVRVHRELGIVLNPVGDTGESVSTIMGDLIQLRTGDEEEAESARLLYVAMTRAKERLILSGSAIKPSSKPSAGTGSWMRRFASEYKLDARAHGEEDADDSGVRFLVWRDLDDNAPTRVATKAKSDIAVDEALLRRIQPVVPVAATRTVFAVTEIIHTLFPDDTKFDTAREQTERSSAVLRGRLAHRLFELWQSSADPHATIDELLRYECPRLDMHASLRESLRQIASAAQHRPELRDLANPQTRRELPFAVRVGDAIIQGVIDAVLPDGAIIDYKTGRRTPENEKRYRWQVSFYTAALHRLAHTPPRPALIYYVDEKDVLTVPVSNESFQEIFDDAARAIRTIRERAPSPIEDDPLAYGLP